MASAPECIQIDDDIAMDVNPSGAKFTSQNHHQDQQEQDATLITELKKLTEKLFNHPDFYFGPYLPIIKKDSALIIDQSNIIDPHCHKREKSDLTDIKVGDSLLECPSLVTPLLLKKPFSWPQKYKLDTMEICDENEHVTQDEQSLDGESEEYLSTSENPHHMSSCEEQSIVDETDNRLTGDLDCLNARQAECVNDDEANHKSSYDYVRSTTLASLKCPYGPTSITLSIKSPHKTSSAKLLSDIGLSRVQEWVTNSEINLLKKELKTDPKLESQIEKKKKERDLLHTNNEFYVSKQSHRCSRCLFKTEFQIVLDEHLKYPHRNSKRDFLCNWCDLKTRDTKQILYHCLIEHKKHCQIEPAHLNWRCIFCPIESKSKKKIEIHIERCRQVFANKPIQNTLDYLSDKYDFPGLTSKPIYREDVKYYEEIVREIKSKATKLAKSPKNINNKAIANDDIMLNPTGITNKIRTMNSFNIIKKNGISKQNERNQNGMVNSWSSNSNLDNHSSLLISNLSNPTIPLQGNTSQAGDGLSDANAQTNKSNKGNTYVICEICDAYLLDLNLLRSHMQCIHNVKLNFRTLKSRPPLHCQKCKWRFFTDQGLDRHLLGTHSLVTNNLQEQVNEGLDSGRCTICGKAFVCQFVRHMREDHHANLKSAHLSYKCTICSASFNLYRLFENHVYSIHSISQPQKTN